MLAGALLAAAAPTASAVSFEDAARKALLREGARASSGGIVALPLGPSSSVRATTAARGDVRALAARRAPARVLISVSSHSHTSAVAEIARRHGTGVRVIRSLGVVALRANDPARLVGALAGDPRVAAIEQNRDRRISADPADSIDPSTGIPFGWAFDAVRAAPALAATGGGSERAIAVIDSGVDVTHPDLAGRVNRTYNSNDGSSDAFDGVGHGTFVTGMISMNHDNDLGGRGAGGTTPIIGIRADDGAGSFGIAELLEAKDFAIRAGADIMNMSLGGDTLTESEARALEFAFLNDVLPVAAAGNAAEAGNPVQFPAAAVGGERGAVGIGLSVGATKPDGTPAGFSTHNRFVSVAAPGAAQQGCQHGVFSTIPQNRSLIFDDPQGCANVFDDPDSPRGRYAYSEGTSFAAPLASGIAALAWQVERRLHSEQVADVVQRSASQTFRAPGWNEFTGHGVVNGEAAVAEAARYDVTPPNIRTRARRTRTGVRLRISGSGDRTAAGDDLAGRVVYGIAVVSRSGVRFVAGPSRRAITRSFRLRRRTTFAGVACDANGNCASRRFGTFSPRRRR